MRILSMDSSSTPASVAVLEEEKILAEFFINTKMTHSQTLMPMVKNVMDMAGTTMDDIDLVAVTKGPGSFTGVRIGVSCAKGIAFPCDIPCAGISALEALAYNLNDWQSDAVVFSCMDARCGQVYNGIFKISDGKIIRLVEDRTIKIEELFEEVGNYEGEIYLIGDGAEFCYQSFKDVGVKIVPENIRYQRASSVAMVGMNQEKNGLTINADALQPMYLQLPQAQRELNAKNKLKKQ